MNSAVHELKKMRITFVIARYSISGVPLAQIRLAKAFRRMGHHVDMIFGYIAPGLDFPAVEGVNVIILGVSKTHRLFMPVVSFIRKTKPDIVFSAEDHLNAIVTLAMLFAGSKAKLSVSSRVNPYDTYSKRLIIKGRLLKLLLKLVIYRADALTCVSKDMVEQYRLIFPGAPHICIYNIIDDETNRQRMLAPITLPWFTKQEGISNLVAAGRLEPGKGFDTLIKAFTEVLKNSQARLLILGDGPSRVDLERLVEINGLQHAVKMPGFVKNPLKYFRNADVFVLSSQLEGLPNVLVEAMICGCTPVATDCPTGPREVLADGKYGYLVPVDDSIAMSAAIIKAIDEPISADLLSEAVKPFSEQPVIDAHIKSLKFEMEPNVNTIRIAVITARYNISGVPLAQIRLARAFVKRGYTVDLIFGYIDPSYTLPCIPGINILCFDKSNSRGMLIPLLKYFRKCKPDIVFSAEDQLSFFVLTAGLISCSKAKISCSSRVTPLDTYPKSIFTKGAQLKQLMKLVIGRADALTCVSNGMAIEYQDVFKSRKFTRVFNIVDFADSRNQMLETVDHPWFFSNDGVPRIVAAGRLAPWKGFDTLVRAMVELLKSRQARLLILGDGESRDYLEKMIGEYGLENNIQLAGYVDNPLKYFRHSDVYVLSSRVEGMGNVLVEAMMCGCTVVSTDCPTGPREVLADGKYGILVPVDDSVSMAEAIARAIDSPFPKHILDDAVKPFTEDKIINNHFELLGIAEIQPVRGSVA